MKATRHPSFFHNTLFTRSYTVQYLGRDLSLSLAVALAISSLTGTEHRASITLRAQA